MTALEQAAKRRAEYIDESGEPKPSWRAEAAGGSVSVYGDHLIGSFATYEGFDVNVEVRGGRLFLYAFLGEEGGEVAFDAEQSRAFLRAASHMLVANTMAAAKVLGAEEEFHEVRS